MRIPQHRMTNIGELITLKGLKINPVKVQCVQTFPELKTPKDINAYLD